MKREILTACLLAGAICSAAFADALNVKPGLWETTVSSPGGSSAMGAGGIPPEALARMTPEQRAQVEAVMRARGGGSGGQSGSQATVTKSCLTQDQLSRPLTFGQDNNGACKISLVTSSRARQEMSVTCDNAKFKSTGTLIIESQDSEHYTGQSADPGRQRQRRRTRRHGD